MRFFKLILFFFLFGCTCLLAQDFNFKVRNLTTEEGLPHNIIEGIEQDDRGFIWVSTEGGLGRFDGYSFKIFSHNPNDSTTISTNQLGPIYKLQSGNFIFFPEKNIIEFDPLTQIYAFLNLEGGGRTLAQGADGTIWIGTNARGLFHYTENFELIEHYTADGNKKNSLVSNSIKYLFCDDLGNLWISHKDNGLSQLQINSKTIKNYPFIKQEEEVIEGSSPTLNTANISQIIQTDEENLWLATSSGLVKFNLKKEIFTHFRYASFDLDNVSNSRIENLLFHKGQIWCGTSNFGLLVFDLKSGKFKKKYEGNSYNSYGLLNSNIFKMFYSRDFEDGVLWVATPNALSRLDLEQKQFELFRHIPEDNKSLSFNGVRTIFKDERLTFVGGDGDQGLNIIDNYSGKIKRFSFNSDDEGSIGPGSIGSIVRRDDGKYWITTWKGSLNLYNPDNDKFQNWKSYHNDIGLEGWVFCDGKMDKLGNYWISALGKGILKMPSGSEKFTKTYAFDGNEEGGLPHKVVRTIFIDPKGPKDEIWFGTNAGLSHFNSEKERFINYLQNVEDYPQLTCNEVLGIYRDSEGIFWLGMDGCGLIKFDIKKNTVETFTTSDGLPSNIINAVYADADGDLWLSTSNGISKFQIAKKSFKNFSKEDGLQGKQFNWRAHFQDDQGKIYFGGPKGLTAFYPSQIKDNVFEGKAFITDILVKGKKVKVGEEINGQILLKEPIGKSKQLEIRYENNDFSIDFTATHFANPLQNSFKYFLEGYDDEWRETTSENRRASYANLPSGKYKFKVIASNNDKKWGNGGDEITLVVFPPWWASWWFRMMIVTIIIISAISFYKIRMRNLKIQKKLLEEKVLQRTSELQEANDEINTQNEELSQQAEELQQQRDYLQEANNLISKNNEQIKASINYAKRIQNAVLPLDDELNNAFEDHFVIFRPRDIVSGDFYWLHEDENFTHFAVVDCTGHGVPGAFMSMIGSSLLNRIISELKIYDPAEILEKLNRLINISLKQDKSNQKDGMDMVICAFPKAISDKGKVSFAGAKNSVFIKRHDNKEVEEIKGNRHSIGGGTDTKATFETKEILLKSKDTLYLLTDGIIDQNRAKDRKRLGRKLLKEKLQSLNGQQMFHHKTNLEEFLDNFMEGETQRDDIALVGIRIGDE